MDIAEKIRKNLKEYRLEFDLSQEHVASIINVDRSIVSNYETGSKEVPLHHLEKLADYFGIELEDLLENDKVGLAFAFRAKGFSGDDLKSIAEFKKIVKNYLKLKEIEHETE